MKIMIIASSEAPALRDSRTDSAGFDRACLDAAALEPAPVPDKPIQADGRPVYVSSALSARRTAEQLFPGAPLRVESLLDEIPLRSYKDTDRELSAAQWRRMARLQRALGSSRQPESRKQTALRAERLLEQLEAQGEDCILVSHPGFIAALLDRFRARGYDAARSGIFSVKPLERILLTRRDLHCGGCSHNCLLTNPGCGVGRDKARRKAQ